MSQRDLRVGLITTVSTNIGDDLIRAGVQRILQSAFPDVRFDYQLIDRHDPLGLYPMFPSRLRRRLRRGGQTRVVRNLLSIGARLTRSTLARCDMVVQAGTPILFPGCSQNVNSWPVWDAVARLPRRVPVLNLAAGSCYPYDPLPARIDDAADRGFARRLTELCSWHTARDSLTQRLFSSLGYEAPVLVCTALLASAVEAPLGPDDGPILVNYMPEGHHSFYAWDGPEDRAAWPRVARTLIERLRKRHKVVMLAHTTGEADEARRLCPDLPCVWVHSASEYCSLVAGAKAVLANRIHAAIGTAGFGIPAINVGADSRILAVQQCGIPAIHVRHAETDDLEHRIETLLTARASERDRLIALKATALARYVSLLQERLALRSFGRV